MGLAFLSDEPLSLPVIVELVAHVFLFMFMAVCNVSQWMGHQRPSINLWKKSFSTGQISLNDLTLLPGFLCVSSLQTKITVAFSLRKWSCTVAVEHFRAIILLNDWCLDYWNNSPNDSDISSNPMPKNGSSSSSLSSSIISWLLWLLPALELRLFQSDVHINDNVHCSLDLLHISLSSQHDMKFSIENIDIRTCAQRPTSKMTSIFALSTAEVKVSNVFNLLRPQACGPSVSTLSTVIVSLGIISVSLEENILVLLEYLRLIQHKKYRTPSALAIEHENRWNRLLACFDANEEYDCFFYFDSTAEEASVIDSNDRKRQFAFESAVESIVLTLSTDRRDNSPECLTLSGISFTIDTSSSQQQSILSLQSFSSSYYPTNESNPIASVQWSSVHAEGTAEQSLAITSGPLEMYISAVALKQVLHVSQEMTSLLRVSVAGESILRDYRSESAQKNHRRTNWANFSISVPSIEVNIFANQWLWSEKFEVGNSSIPLITVAVNDITSSSYGNLYASSVSISTNRKFCTTHDSPEHPFGLHSHCVRLAHIKIDTTTLDRGSVCNGFSHGANHFQEWQAEATQVFETAGHCATTISVHSIHSCFTQIDIYSLGLLLGCFQFPSVVSQRSRSPYVVQFTERLVSANVLTVNLESVSVDVLLDREHLQGCLENDCYRYRYSLLKEQSIVIQTASIGSSWQESSVSIEGPIKLTVDKETINGVQSFQKMLLQICGSSCESPLVSRESLQLNAMSTSKSFAESHDDWERVGQIANESYERISIVNRRSWGDSHHCKTRDVIVGLPSTHGRVNMEQVTVAVDIKDIAPLLILLREFSLGQVSGQNRSRAHFDVNNGLQRIATTPGHRPFHYSTSIPSASTVVEVKKMKLTFFHCFKPVMTVRALELVSSSASFGGGLTQSTTSLRGLSVAELSADYAVHKVIIDSVHAPSAPELLYTAQLQAASGTVQQHELRSKATKPNLDQEASLLKVLSDSASVGEGDDIGMISCDEESSVLSSPGADSSEEFEADEILHDTGPSLDDVLANYTELCDNMPLRNKLEICTSSIEGQPSLVEISAEHLRVIYLQRATMTLLSFLRDYFFNDLSLYLSPFIEVEQDGEFERVREKWRDNKTEAADYDRLYDSNAVMKKAAVELLVQYETLPQRLPGLFRMSMLFRRGEVHLPMNSCSPEAIVIPFRTLSLIRCSSQMENAGLVNSYCSGPLVSKAISISDGDNIYALTRSIFSDNVCFENSVCTSNRNSVIAWKLPQYRSYLICPIAEPYDYSQTYLLVKLRDAALCTWCNETPIAISQDLDCKIEIEPSIPNNQETGSETIVHEDEGTEEWVYDLAADDVRNTISVSVDAEKAFWTLTQGQYWGIVNLLQQNFCELQEHVVDVFILPTAVFIPDLPEECYGKNCLKPRLPIVNTTPIRIKTGRIVAALNESQYYSRIIAKLPPPEVCIDYYFHDMTHMLRSMVPAHAQHHKFREQIFAHDRSYQPPAQGQYLPTAYFVEGERTDKPFAIVFENLFADFYRHHFYGGNGIEVSGDSFVVVASRKDVMLGRNNGSTESNDKDELFDFDHYSAANIVFGPKRAFGTNDDDTPISDLKSDNKNLEGSQSCAVHEEVEDDLLLEKQRLRRGQRTQKQHIRYDQQGCANLRRCVVTVDNSILVAHVSTIMSLVHFFHAPIRVNFERNSKVIDELKIGPFDWRLGLDVEVHLNNTAVCLPNITSLFTVAGASMPTASKTTSSRRESIKRISLKRNGVSSDRKLAEKDSVEDLSALCFRVKLDYQHSWRGFLQAGPGKERFTVDSSIAATFIAPVSEALNENVQPLVDPVKIDVEGELLCLPERIRFDNNMSILTPYNKFGKWVTEPNPFDRSTGKRTMLLLIYPLSSPPPPSRRNFGSTYSFKNEMSNEKNSDSDVESDMETTEVSSDKAQEDDSERVHDNVSANLTLGQCSLRDIEFILHVIQTLQKGLSYHLKKVHIEMDPFQDIAMDITDIRHLPPLMYFLLYTSASSSMRVDVKQVTADICNFNFHIRNNTYNLQLLRLDLYAIQLLYDRTPRNWHMAAGVKAAVWSYNDDIDDWEPIVEPIQMTAVGSNGNAAAPSKGTVVASLTDASNWNVKVNTDALDINAGQQAITSLLRKVQLNDVVTTASQRLPPYKLINELGVPLNFKVGFDHLNVVDSQILPNKTLPIEVSELSEALNSYRRRKMQIDGTTIDKSIEEKRRSDGTKPNKEYLLWVSFQHFGEMYESANLLSMDRVGSTAMDMKATNPGDQSNGLKVLRWLGIGGSNTTTRTTVLTDDVQDSHRATMDMSSGFVGEKLVHDVPLAFLDMKIKGDGVRELHLRSVVSIKNSTTSPMDVGLKLFGNWIDAHLEPGKDWIVPLTFAHPKASVWLKTNKARWLRLSTSLSQFISQGYWGCPQRLMADIAMCPAEYGHDITGTDDKWVLLLRPEANRVVRGNHKAVSSTSTGSVSSAAQKMGVPVRYPTKDSHKNRMQVQSSQGATKDQPEIIEDTASDNIPNLPMLAPAALMKRGIRPLCLHIQAPLQLCNLLSQALLYRMAYVDGNVVATGLILPGQIIDIHALPQLFNKKLMVSVRMINYGWSDWSMIFSRTQPYNASDKTSELVLNSLQFDGSSVDSCRCQREKSKTKDNVNPLLKDHFLPSVEISMSVQEFLVRFSCPLVLSNCTGIDLLLAESSTTENFLPLRSSVSTLNVVVDDELANAPDTSVISRSQRRPQAFRKRSIFVTEEFDIDNTDSDEEESAPDPDNAESDLVKRIPADMAVRNVRLYIRMPHDHRKRVEVICSDQWRLSDVFFEIRRQISPLDCHANLNDYMFLYFAFQNGMPLPALGDDNAQDEETQTTLNESSDKSHREVPEVMRMGLIVDLSSEALLMQLFVNTLTSNQLLLIHRSEYAIYLQASTIQTEEQQREGFMRSVLGRSKFFHRAQFVPIVGEFPFHPRRLLGLQPNLSLTLMHNESCEWSAGLDIAKGDFDIGEMTISVTGSGDNDVCKKSINTNTSDSSAASPSSSISTVFEFGAYVEKGQGLLQNSTVVTLVPKHVIVSKLSFSIDLRLIPVPGAIAAPITLPSNSTVTYYFPTKNKVKMMHLRRTITEDLDGTNALQQKSNSHSWMGEVDICTIGIVYIKLRDPMLIIRVETEIIGASIVASFQEQSLIWPPYKICNMTESRIRFRQQSSDMSGSLLGRIGGFIGGPSKMTGEEGVIATSTSDSNLSASLQETSTSPASSSMYSELLPWDYLDAGESCSYTWDFPLSGNKLLTLEVEEKKQWTGSIVGLDDENKIESVVLKKSVPNLGNSLAEGDLLRHVSGDTWSSCYCILRPDLLYIYNDKDRHQLLNIISLVDYDDQSLPKFAVVSRNTNKSWDISSFIGSVLGNNIADSVIGSAGGNGPAASRIDFNGLRRLLFRVATAMGLIFNYTVNDFKTARSESDDELDSHRSSIKIEESPVEADVTSKSAIVDSHADDSQLELDELKLENVKVSPEDLESHSLDLLRSGITIEQMLDKVSNRPLRMIDVLSAIQSLKEINTEDQAIDLCNWLYTEHWLAAADSNESDGDEPGDEDEGFDGVGSLHSPVIYSNKVVTERASIANFEAASPPKVAHTASPWRSSRASSSRGSYWLPSGLAPSPQVTRQSMSRPSSVVVTSANKMTAVASKKLSKKSEFLLVFEDIELFVKTPPLHAELLSLLERENARENSDATAQSSQASVAAATVPEDELCFGLSFPNGTKMRLKCSSELSLCGWMQSSRTAIEKAFEDMLLGKRVKVPRVDDFQSIVLMKVRPDGSTKLLEIIEDSESQLGPTSLAANLIDKSSQFVSNALTLRKRTGKNSFAAARKRNVSKRSASSIVPMFAKSRALFYGSKKETTASDSAEETDVDRPLLTVEFMVHSVSLSLIDAEPTELLYLRLQDLNMSIVRYFDAVQFGVTVKELQASSQLLHATFPVALCAKRIPLSKDASGDATSHGNIRSSMDSDSLPSLHLHLQQKYHHLSRRYRQSQQNLTPEQQKERQKEKQQLKESAKLWYFDSFTLWLAPLHCALDEELVVRILRYIHSMTLAVSQDEHRKVQRLKEDSATRSLEKKPNESSDHSPTSGASKQSTEDTNLEYAVATNWLYRDLLTATAVNAAFREFSIAGLIPYAKYRNMRKSSLNLYFTTLQLHPLDVSLHFRTSPELKISNSELALITILTQLDGMRMRLNALIAENAYGSESIIAEILAKHYKSSFWKQFHRLLGAADIVEDSVGLVANLGSGVYDILYDPVAGSIGALASADTLDANAVSAASSSFFQGLSKGGANLASRAIGGTSAITSKITGGIGQGVSLLTLDSEFQRLRSYRRYNQANSVAEGLMVGTQELGRNIVSGFTGIVVSPYRGWEQGGGVGFGVGVAKGILGVALKPAVGVLDLASRATEGIRNTVSNNSNLMNSQNTYSYVNNNNLTINDIDQLISSGALGSRMSMVSDNGMSLSLSLHRARLPRSFGRAGRVFIYDKAAAVAQFIADTLPIFQGDNRQVVVDHLCIRRRIMSTELSDFQFLQSRNRFYGTISPPPMKDDSSGGKSATATSVERLFEAQWCQCKSDYGQVVVNELSGVSHEAWGMREDVRYIVLVGMERISLVKLVPQLVAEDSADSKTNPNESIVSSTATNARRRAVTMTRRLVWSCPADSVEQLYHDTRGDLVLSVNNPVQIASSLSSSSSQQLTCPIVVDVAAQNYLLFQSLLEQTLGVHFARQQPLHPWKGHIQSNIRKMYSTGVRSMMQSHSQHTYRLYGNVLYEYTRRGKSSVQDFTDEDSMSANKNGRTEPMLITNSIEFAEQEVLSLFSGDAMEATARHRSAKGKAESSESTDASDDPSSDKLVSLILRDHYLSFVFPLVDVLVTGPHIAEAGAKFTLSIKRIDGNKMRTIRREDGQEIFSEYMKNGLVLIFDNKYNADLWKDLLASHIVLQPPDPLPTNPLTTEERKKAMRTVMRAVTGRRGEVEVENNSILSLLALPTSGCDPAATEKIKIQIAETLSLVQKQMG